MGQTLILFSREYRYFVILFFRSMFVFGHPERQVLNHLFMVHRIRSKASPLSQSYVESIVGPPGVGTSCMPDVMLDKNSEPYPSCRYTNNVKSLDPKEEIVRREKCSCASAENKMCSGENVEFKFLKYHTNSTDVIYQLIEGGNLTDWIMLTFDDFIEHRSVSESQWEGRVNLVKWQCHTW